MLLVYMAAVAEDSLLMERAPLRAPETVKATGLDVHVVLVMACQGSQSWIATRISSYLTNPHPELGCYLAHFDFATSVVILVKIFNKSSSTTHGLLWPAPLSSLSDFNSPLVEPNIWTLIAALPRFNCLLKPSLSPCKLPPACSQAFAAPTSSRIK